MTEAEWTICADPKPMLEFLRGKTSERKLRLFAVSCYKRNQHRFNGRGRASFDVAERFAEGFTTMGELRAAKAGEFVSDLGDATATVEGAKVAADSAAWDIAFANAAEAFPDEARVPTRPEYDPYSPAHAAARLAETEGYYVELAAQCELLRDIFGNPFRPANLDPSLRAWNEGAISNMAQFIYNDRAFDRLPLLADALEDAGCTDAVILAHCRQPGEHVCGCWVLDLLLGKS